MVKAGDLHCIFNGQSRKLKVFLVTTAGAELRHVFECHDVGVNDQYITAGEDVYGSRCKCPPGTMYTLGSPQACATGTFDAPHINNDDDRAYGFWFTPINDDPAGDMAKHGRGGIGIHGGGSDLANSFAARQGWEYTLGCLRLQNEDNATFVNSVQYVQAHGGTCYLDVVWP